MIYGSGMMPATGRPQITRETALGWAKEHGVTDDCFILGRRGYFRDTMGKKGANDRSVYDDAIVIVGPNLFLCYNGNTDPAGQGGRLASVVAGAFWCKQGLHHPGSSKEAPCLVQDGPWTVRRDNGVTESGEFYIHVHCGFFGETGSAGCQTLPPTQWSATKLRELGVTGDGPLFFDDVCALMKAYGLKRIRYVLSDRGAV